MFTHRKLIIPGLALCAMMAGATAPGLAARVSAAPAAPTIKVAAQVSTSYLSMPSRDETFRTIAVHRLTLRITGSNFTPGSKVRIAVMNTSPWKLFAKGSTYAQDAVSSDLCPNGRALCSWPNPRAGTIDYRMRFSYAPAASSLVVLYRSAGHTGLHDLTLTQP
jgi:hypothetical protein